MALGGVDRETRPGEREDLFLGFSYIAWAERVDRTDGHFNPESLGARRDGGEARLPIGS